MKYKVILLIICLVIIIFLAVFILSKKNNNKLVLKDTTSFRLFFTKGYMMNADICYEYKLENNKYIMTIKPYLKDSSESVSFEVDKSVIEEIESILNKYGVYKWNNFNKSNKYVLDGDSFSFSVKTNQTDISASGYMSYPENYGNVLNEVKDIFEREEQKNK